MSEKELCWSHDEEDFSYDSLGELLDADEDFYAGRIVYFGEKRPIAPIDLIRADQIVDQADDALSDMVDDSYKPFQPTAEALEELNGLVDGWFRKHLKVQYFTIHNVQPYTLTEDDLSGREGGA